MSEAKKRKVRTPESKAKEGLEALQGMGKTNEIGQEYGCWSTIKKAPNRSGPFW